MKRYFLIMLFSAILIFYCESQDDFSSRDYSYLEENEWKTSYGLEEWGEVKILRVADYEKILQQKWWDGSFRVYDLQDSILLDLGNGAEYKVEFLNDGTRFIYRCINNIGNSGIADRISPPNRSMGRDE